MDTGTITKVDAALENGAMEQEELLMFDTSSGISEEEQREILAGIDAITAQNRISASPTDLNVKANKKGNRFPVLVNLSALLVLGGGLFLIFFLHQQSESQFRQGTPYLGLTERRLIQEIRQESAGKINAKDQEIAGIMAKLAELDRELQNLQQSIDKRIQEKEAELRQQMEREIEEERKRLMGENVSETALAERMRIFEEQKNNWLNTELAAFQEQLNAERLAAEVELQKLRQEYQRSLAQLQAERVQILEAARIQEENLHAQLQEKTNELNALSQQSRDELEATRDELYHLNDEWERSALIERELSGFYTTVNNQIQEGRLSEAANTLNAMREFITTPSFQNLRPIQSRKEFYMSSINVLSEIIEGTLFREPPIPVVLAETENLGNNTDYDRIIAELRTQNDVLEQTIAAQDQTIADFNRQTTNQNSTGGQASGDSENTINTLRRQNASLQQTVNARDSTINTLRSQNTSLQQTVTSRDTTINALRSQNTGLQQIVTAHEITIKEFRTQNTTLQQTITTYENTVNELRTQTANLQQTLSSRDSTITSLRTQNTSLSQTVTTRDTTIGDLRTQNASLQQTVNARESTISDLRTQNTTLQQRVEQLQQTNDAVRKLLNQ
jgi:chromosome segregation ATPase